MFDSLEYLMIVLKLKTAMNFWAKFIWLSVQWRDTNTIYYKYSSYYIL